MLELDDIQSGVLRPRPGPYAATYLLLRIDARAAGRAFVGRLRPLLASAAHPSSPAADTWVSVALTYAGLVALGVPQASLDSFAWEFRQGMAARAKALGDAGESAPEHWEKPLGTERGSSSSSSRSRRLRSSSKPRSRARGSVSKNIPGSRSRSGGKTATRSPPEGSTSGSRMASAHPAIEGSGLAGTATPRSRRSKRASSSSATATRRAAFRPCPSPTSSAATGPTSCSASFTSAWRSSDDT